MTATPLFNRFRKRRDDGTRVDARAITYPWRVVRHDGVVLAGVGNEAVAVRLASVISQGQVPQYARAERRGGR